MRIPVAAFWIVLALLVAGMSTAQRIGDDFDSQTTGSAPAWRWWSHEASGTVEVDGIIFRGASGKSVEILRTTFDGKEISFGQNFPPLSGPAEHTFYFRVDSTNEELLTVVGGNNAGHQVASRIGVGGEVGNAIGTYSETAGWNHVMDVSAGTWYGTTLKIDPSTHTYDITVWEDNDPANTATETGIDFQNGTNVDTIDQILFGNFSESAVSSTDSAYVDDVSFVGSRVLEDGFDSGNLSGWSRSTNPVTTVTSCEQVVTTDAVLSADLNCPSGAMESAGVEFGASNIFLDLGGHTLTGHPMGIGVKAWDVDRVTVKNGQIRDFGVGIAFNQTDTGTVRNVSLVNLVEDDPDEFLPSIRVTDSEDILIRESFIKFLPVAHKEAVVIANSQVTVDNIEVDDASVGVNISGWCNDTPKGSNVSVINGRYVGVTIAGVLAQCTESSLVAENEFSHNEAAVSVDNVEITPPGNISGLVIEDNSIHHGFIGVHFMGNFSCSILNNVMHDGWRGIFIDSAMGCDPEVYQSGCSYASSNVISGNVVTDYFIDLYHHPLATGNTWTDNTCDTTEGAEIPACIAP